MAGSSPVPTTSAPSPQLSILLATLNEGGNLPELMRRLDAATPADREVIVLDDGSTDGSREFLEKLAASDRRVRLIYHDSPQTTLRAHLLGIQAARGTWVLIMDADLQHPPGTIPELLAALQASSDVAVATRYSKGGKTKDRSFRRAFISHVAQFLAARMLVSVRGLTDPMSGFLAFRRSSVPPMDPSARGFKILLYLLASSPPLRVTEVPYTFDPRVHGSSKVVSGWGFLRMYMAELRRARKIERKVRHEGRASRGASAPSTASGDPPSA